MLVLAFDTATAVVSVAVGDDGAVLGEIRLSAGRRHAETLVPAISYLCDGVGVDLAHVAAIAVGLGPGLFTGLRVGVTTAKMMAQALRVPVVGVPSLDLVAWPLRHTSRTVVAVLDARRREVFHARYRPLPGGLERLGDYSVGTPAALVGELQVEGNEVLLAGDGVDAYRECFDGLEHAERAGAEFVAPSAAALVDLATRRIEREEFDTPWDVRPLYLRASDAEIEWDRSRTGVARDHRGAHRPRAADAASPREVGPAHRGAGLPAPVEHVVVPLGARAADHARVLRRACRPRRRRVRRPDDDGGGRSRHDDRGRSEVAPAQDRDAPAPRARRARPSRATRRT